MSGNGPGIGFDRTGWSAEDLQITTSTNIPIAAEANTDPETQQFLTDVLEGLSARRKSLPCKYFYDSLGSKLFDQICDLDEYYLTRTEKALLTEKAGEIGELLGPGVTLIEFGCGSLTKIRILLDALETPAAFVPIDIATDHLNASVADLATMFPALVISPVSADFTLPLDLTAALAAGTERRAGFFPGSTIGNFDHTGARAFMQTLAGTLGPGAMFIVGVDLKKQKSVIERAYNDAKGVTAAFNMNLLVRINRELGADFDLDQFRHHSHYDEDLGRVEMHLVSTCVQTVTINGRAISFEDGEAIHTENSYKYSIEEFTSLAEGAGFRPVRVWTDAADLFAIHALAVG